ncbi:MAG: hypothetical protein QNJ67_05605 [Kiloniellales bacterium]|nr:hypothetical protein [Kiloniellales bacterium]
MPEALEQEIKAQLDEVAALANGRQPLATTLQGPGSSNDWTLAITDRLCQMGHELGYEACGKSTFRKQRKKGFPGEWLYDVCWLDYDRSSEAYTDLVLAVESEWLHSFDEIWNDFCKLIQCRAGLRVMIFEQPTLEKIRQTRARLEPAIIAFRASQQDDRYLFCGLWSDADGYRFSHSGYTLGRGWHDAS